MLFSAVHGYDRFGSDRRRMGRFWIPIGLDGKNRILVGYTIFLRFTRAHSD